MAREYLRRARVLVVCGGTVNESVKKRHRRGRAPADHRHHAGRDSHRQGTGAEPLTHCRLLRRLRVPP